MSKYKLFPTFCGLTLIILMGLIACEGPDGPIGQTGPMGPQGVPGNPGDPGDPGVPCTVEDNGDGTFTMTCAGSSITFGETEEPADYLSANVVRGGLLYDKFWAVSGAEEPSTEHPLYPSFGAKTGSTTWRCKECHGWDYIGKDGRYASGSHYSGIEGLYPPEESLWRAFMVINEDHGFGDAGLTSADIWDLVKFYREGMVDVDASLNEEGVFDGNVSFGKTLYDEGIFGFDAEGTKTNISCAVCHGSDGTTELTTGFDAYVGFLSNENPQEFQHKVRFGHPGSDPAMPATEAINASLRDVLDLLAYSQTLSPIPWDNTSVLRGGRLYDKYWAETEGAEPTGEHNMYPSYGPRTGNTTWRCKECHGWDYIGKDGRYSSGSHYTGIDGVYPVALTKWQAFGVIKDNHGYGNGEMEDEEIWNLVAFYNAGTYNLNFILNNDGTFKGDTGLGFNLYENGIGGSASCASCHGSDGLTEIVPGFDAFPGFLSNDNPQEFAHKVLFGHPGSIMGGTYDNGATIKDIADLSAYAQTLPVN